MTVLVSCPDCAGANPKQERTIKMKTTLLTAKLYEARATSPEHESNRNTAMNCRRLAAIFFATLFFFVASSADARAGGRYYNHGDSIQTSHPDWMKWLPDNLNLSHVALPGTHDTMAFYGGDGAQTQSLSLTSQLNAGIRVLDIRCRHIQNVFAIHHGPVFQNAMFGDVLAAAAAFLDAHPTETILMRVKEEHDPENNTRSFEDTFVSYRSQFSSHIWTPPNDKGYMPNLGDVRGKIVIIQNFSDGGSNSTYGVAWSLFSMQDEYNVPTIFDIDDKWEKAKEHFVKLNSDKGVGPKWAYMNFLSGTSFGAYPYTVAGGTGAGIRGVNDYALEYLFKGNAQRVGVVMMDFPGAGLIDAIIAHNFRLAADNGNFTVDYEHVFRNTAYSTEESDGGEALGRLEGMRLFLNHILPNRFWHMMVLKPGWGYYLRYDALFASSGQIDDFTHTAFVSNEGHSEVGESELNTYVASQLDSLSGGLAQRASQLANRVKTQYPGQHWSVIVKQEPGGFDNWAYVAWGARAHIVRGGYIYAVWGYARNDPPIAVAGGPYTGQEGSAIVFDGSSSSDPENIPLAYRWDFNNDGTWDTVWSFSPTASHTWDDDFSGLVRLEVNDGKLSATATASVTVHNVKPSLSPLTAILASEDDEVTMTVTFNDPGNDTHTIYINWGDGSPRTTLKPVRGERAYTVKHRYVEDNPTGTPQDKYTRTVTVDDDNGGRDSKSVTDTISDVAPVVVLDSVFDETGARIGVDVPVALVGTEVRITGHFNDKGVRDTHRATFAWGDGATTLPTLAQLVGGGNITDRHFFNSPVEALLVLTITDDDTLSGSAQVSIRVLTADEATQQATDTLLRPLLTNPTLDAATRRDLQRTVGYLDGAAVQLKKGNENAGMEKIVQALQSLEATLAANARLSLVASTSPVLTTGGKLPPAASVALKNLKRFVALTAKAVYVKLLAAARAAAPKPPSQRKISEASAIGARAWTKLAAGDHLGAGADYLQAVRILHSIPK